MSSTGSNEHGQNATEADNSIADEIDLCYDSDDDVLYESDSSNDSDVRFDEIKSITKYEQPASSTSTQKPAVSHSQGDEKVVPTLTIPVQKDVCIDIQNEFRNKSEEDIISSLIARLTWLSCNAISNMQGGCLTPPDPKDIYHLSCVLWISQELACCDKISALLTRDKFDLFLQWSLTFAPSSVIKLALDRVLCSMYALKPEMFPELLEKFNIFLPARTNDDISENSETAHCFIHIRATSIICHPYEGRLLSTPGCLSMNNNKYRTLAQLSMSNMAALQLIHSGYLALLIDVIIEFCSVNDPHAQTVKEMMDVEVRRYTIEDIVRIVRFLSELCEEGSIRIWLASDEVRMFWDELFKLLCYEPPQLSHIDIIMLRQLADAAVIFFTKCCQCYPANLEKLVNTITTNLPKLVKRDESNATIISDFGRKIISELIMGAEYIYASVEINLDRPINFSWSKEKTKPFLPPPNYPPSNRQRFMYLDTDCTSSDIIEKILGESIIFKNVQHVNKRIKLEVTEKKMPCLFLWDSANLKFFKVEENLTVAQMLTILLNKGNALEDPIIKFLLTEKTEENGEESIVASFYDVMPFSFLKMLTDANIFAQVCAKIPRPNEVHKSLKCTKYPWHYPTMQSTSYAGNKLFGFDSDNPFGVTSDHVQGFSHLGLPSVATGAVYGYNIYGMPGTSREECVKSLQPVRLREWSTIPLLSLVMHGQCLKLVEYREEIEARSILQPITSKSTTKHLDIDKTKVLFSCNPQRLENPLATLPLELLRFCFMTTFNERQIRKATVKNGIVDLIFASLAIFTHNSKAVEEDYIQNRHLTLIKCLKQCTGNAVAQPQKGKWKEGTTKHCWPKGIGYGTGNEHYTSYNDQNKLQKRLKTEEEYVTILFQVLASFIQPDYRLYDLYQNYMNEICDLELGTGPDLPPEFLDFLERSCLLPVLVDYLRNDSILDIARHVSLYTAIMQLLRCMASNTQTVKFVISNDHLSAQCSTSSSTKFTSIQELLTTMKNRADTYSVNYLTKKTSVASAAPVVTCDEVEVDEEALIVDIQITAIILNIIKQKLSATCALHSPHTNETNPAAEVKVSNEQRYLEVMGKLRFASYDIISENSENQLLFNVQYAFCSEASANTTNATTYPARIRRIAQEMSSLSTSLPITCSSSVFVRCDTDRLDIMKVLITGPAHTPYMNGCFEFDVYFPCTYPNTPMLVKLVTTGRSSVRFNPNLYENGKVCLSLLNTWQGQPEEKWNAQTSSLIQVLISIQALILVPDPYFNEPGFQSTRGTKTGDASSRQYNSKLLPQTIKWAMLEQIRNPNPCFREVINTHFWLKRDEIGEQISKWLREETDTKTKAAIHKNYRELKTEFSKLKPPAGTTD